MTNQTFLILLSVILLVGYIVPILMFWITPPGLKFRDAAAWPVWVTQRIFNL